MRRKYDVKDFKVLGQLEEAGIIRIRLKDWSGDKPKIISNVVVGENVLTLYLLDKGVYKHIIHSIKCPKNDGYLVDLGIIYEFLNEGIQKLVSKLNEGYEESEDFTEKSDIEFCTQCGTKLPENSKFCYKCGFDLSKINTVGMTFGKAIKDSGDFRDGVEGQESYFGRR